MVDVDVRIPKRMRLKGVLFNRDFGVGRERELSFVSQFLGRFEENSLIKRVRVSGQSPLS